MMAGHHLMADEMHLYRIRGFENRNQEDSFLLILSPFWSRMSGSGDP
jgi:hypothetical protein